MGKLCVAMALTGVVRLLGFATEPLLDDRQIHRVAGEPRRLDRPVRQRDHLNVVTWNIERGLAYEPVVAVLRALDADILLLQEVDRFCRRTAYRDVARDLAYALEMNWVAAGEFQEVGEGRSDRPALHGQTILSRFPIEDAEVLRFRSQARWRWSINPVQPRRGGRIALKARTGGFLLYNTHIESGGNESLQRSQIAEILTDETRHRSDLMPVIIGGDFNNGPVLRSSLFGSLSAAAFADALGSGQRGPTSLGQRHPIDWIFVKNITPVRGRVVNAAASDHFPLIAALDSQPALVMSR